MTNDSFEIAADSYVLACCDLIQQWKDSAGAPIDSTAADRALLEAFGAERGRPIVDAAHAVFKDCARFTDRMNQGRGGGYDDQVAFARKLSLGGVVQAADALLTSLEFSEQAELDAAEAELATAEAKLAAGRADLEAAVNRADLVAVGEFGPEVELRLPVRINELTAAVLDLRIRRTEAAQLSPRRRLERVGAAGDGLEAERQAIQRRLVQVEAEMARARVVGMLANGAVANAGQAHDALVGERDRHRDLAAQQRQDAVRRLAGLPTAPTPEPERPTVPERPAVPVGLDVHDPTWSRRVGVRA